MINNLIIDLKTLISNESSFYSCTKVHIVHENISAIFALLILSQAALLLSIKAVKILSLHVLK